MLHKIIKIIFVSLAFLSLIHNQLDIRIGNNNALAFSSNITTKFINRPLPSTNGTHATTELTALHPSWKYLDFQSLPLPGFKFSLVLNPINDVAILFGGYNSTIGELDDLWMTDGFEWIQFQTPHSPGGRDGASLAYDEARQEAVLFGGYNLIALLGDTWSFNGIDWTLRNPTQSPPPRAGASMAYDPDRNLTILFGGQGDTGGDLEPLGDMWIWDGTDWQQQFPVHLPSARIGANMVYDEARHAMILFGGGAGGGLHDDTWIWDGTDWIEQQPAHRPAGRADFGLAYDENKQVVILYGGQAILPYGTDTWAWDGNDWEQLQTLQTPPEALSYNAKVVYIPALQTVMLFNDHRIKTFDPFTFTEYMEGWILTYQYLNFLPIVVE